VGVRGQGRGDAQASQDIENAGQLVVHRSVDEQKTGPVADAEAVQAVGDELVRGFLVGGCAQYSTAPPSAWASVRTPWRAASRPRSRVLSPLPRRMTSGTSSGSDTSA
jgi:hypothetical protein